MSGILFLKTRDLEGMRDFYLHRVGMEPWFEQPGIALLRHGNLIVGFCAAETSEGSGLLTFFFPRREDVDAAWAALRERARSEPEVNEKYRIYHFFADDPEGRALEFQAFLHPLPPHLDGESLLTTRRSVRRYEPAPVEDGVLARLFEACRFSPTSMNSQSHYFVLTRDGETLRALAALRGSSSAPLARAPLAVAVCGDPSKSGAARQDACIAATYFLLAAWNLGLGTVWIGAMDRPDVKELLGIPEDHHVAAVTPLGYPAEAPEAGERRRARDLFRIVP